MCVPAYHGRDACGKDGIAWIRCAKPTTRMTFVTQYPPAIQIKA
jgi:hypothetical protein